MQIFTIKNNEDMYAIEDGIYYYLSYVSGETCDWHEVYWVGNSKSTFYNEDDDIVTRNEHEYKQELELSLCLDKEDIEDAKEAISNFKKKMKKFEYLLKLNKVSF